MKARANRVHGFTLVEIMIVVVIVGLLSALAVPAMMRVKKKSQETQALNTLRAVYDAKEAYFMEDGAGKGRVSLSALVKAGYASKSLDAISQHDLGVWRLSALRGLSWPPGEPVKLTETTHIGNHVYYGRVLTYP
jgi:prepilin-type N-terminal cleavage/methylation domain-containing protein